MGITGEVEPDKPHVHHHLSAGAVWMFLVVLIVSQFVLFLWKKKHNSSYFKITLAGLWIFPIITCVRLFWWRFTLVWVIVSATLIFLVFKASRKPMDGETPRRVYGFFLYSYRATSFLSVAGYVAIILEIMGFGILLHIHLAPIGILMMTYGLYFGVLCRDWAQVATDIITSTIGYYSKDGIPKRQCRFHQCGICDRRLFPDVRNHGKKDGTVMERTHKLQCGHIVHEFCIRGWVMIGKKDTCPVCREKVNLTNVFKSPWHKQDRAWAQILDAIRYLVVWNPIIIFLGKFVIYELNIPLVVEHTAVMHKHIKTAMGHHH